MKKNKKSKKKKRKNTAKKSFISVEIKQAKDPSISCCMIVKNEEEFLDLCLKSVKDYVDELIIVDTGSTDNTVEIAKKYTEKIYFHPWENNFSKARNQALSYATGDWVFQIDGDEELMTGSGKRLRNAVREATDEDVINVKLLCSYANGTKTSMHNFERLFRNNGIIHYEGRVHNRIVGYKNPVYSQIELWHYGYDVDEEKAQEKFERTRDLLLKDIEDDPNNPLPHHYLSSSYVARGIYKDALREAQVTIQLAENKGNRNHIYGCTYFNASLSLYKLGELEKAQEYSLKALDVYPQHLDSYYMLTMIAGDKSEWSNVFKYGKNFISIWKVHKDNPESPGMMINNTMSEAPAIYMQMGHAHHALKNYKEMDESYMNACEKADEKWLISWNIGVYHLDKSFDMDRAGHFLKLAAREAPEKYKTWYMLAKYYKKCGSINDEINALERVILIGTEDNFIFNRLFTLYAENEVNDKAYSLLNSIKKPDSTFYSNLLKLGNVFMEEGTLESAFQCYMKAAEIQPESPEVWSILSEITYSLGKYDDSQVFVEKALELNDGDILNLLTMCEIKLKIKDFESHITYCNRLMESLEIDTNRTIDGFSDLKDIFIEIGNTVNNEVNCSSKINNIISELDIYVDSENS